MACCGESGVPRWLANAVPDDGEGGGAPALVSAMRLPPLLLELNEECDDDEKEACEEDGVSGSWPFDSPGCGPVCVISCRISTWSEQ
jgi:hypothetical protein